MKERSKWEMMKLLIVEDNDECAV